MEESTTKTGGECYYSLKCIIPYPSLPGKNFLTEDFKVSTMSLGNNNKEEKFENIDNNNVEEIHKQEAA